MHGSAYESYCEREPNLMLEAPPTVAGVQPFVSVIVPCRNEEKFISRCLDSIISNSYPKERMEVLVLDGMSEDMTRSIVEDFSRRYGFIRLVDNPRRTIPAAMNTGIRRSSGEIVIKMDAHSCYEPSHISTCVRYLRESGAENVGGVWNMLPGAETKVAKAVVLALASSFGSGNAHIKVCPKEPIWTDADRKSVV